MIWSDDNIEMVNEIYPDDSDREYDRYLETGEISTISDYSLEDWPYEKDDPKHPNYHGTYSEISDSYDPFQDMHNLTKSYNRKYYRDIFKVHARKHYRLTKLWIAVKLCKLAFFISRDLEKEMLRIIYREDF